MRVLIIEDVVVFQKLLVRLLDGVADMCKSYSNGVDGLNAFLRANASDEPFDVVFLDIMIPGMNGLEVLQKIREVDPDSQKIKVIMVTSVADAEKVKKAVGFGCDGYLIKPYNKDGIMKQLKKLELIKQ